MNADTDKRFSAPSNAAYFLGRALEPIRGFLDDSQVVEISVNRPGEVYVERLGTIAMEQYDMPELTRGEIENIGERVAAISNQFVSASKPLLSAALPTGERIQVVLPPAAPMGGAFSIRKQVINDLSLEQYRDLGALNKVSVTSSGISKVDKELIHFLKSNQVYEFVTHAIRSRVSILISGGTSSGKTTFLNACLKTIDPGERIITLEDTRELFPSQRNSLHLIASKGEQGTADVTIQHLLEASLRMRPDRLFVGEIRGLEAFAFLRAINTGHPGSMSTVHADTPAGAYEQLVMMMMQSGMGSSFSKTDLLDYIRMVIPIVIQLKRSGGMRGISEIYFSKMTHMTKGMKLALVLFCTLIAFAAWSPSYAVILSVAFHDDRVLKATLTQRPFLSLQQFWIYRSYHTIQLVAAGAALPALLISGLVALLCLRSNIKPLGDASFQTNGDLRSGGWLTRKGHIFGRLDSSLIRKIDDRHHLIIGPTRSGKGVGYVIPNALTHQGSMIVTDLKGEIWRLTAGYRKAHGNQVFLFSPGNAATHRYNPLDFIRSDRGTRTTDIQNIASILVPENPDSENAVWQATAQQVMAGAISYILESRHYKGRRNLGEVNSFFNSGFNLQVIMKLIKETEDHLSKFTIESFNAYLALSDRAAASALLDIQKALNPWKNERIVAATDVTDMDLVALKQRPISIYLAPSISDVTLLKPLLTLFVQQTMDIMTRSSQRKSIPVYFLLDEFRQLGRMTEIMTKLPYVAGYGIKLAFIIQDLKNLDEIYGETSRHSLLGNCGYQLVFGANDQATTDYISRALGKTTIRYQSESKTIERLGFNRRTRTEQIRERDLMMPQEIRQLDKEKMIMLAEGQKPILCGKARYHQLKYLSNAAEFSEGHIPEVAIVDLLPFKPVPATTPDYSCYNKDERVSHDSKLAVASPLTSPAIVHATATPNERDIESQISQNADHSGITNTSDFSMKSEMPLCSVNTNPVALANKPNSHRRLSKTAQMIEPKKDETRDLFQNKTDTTP